MTDERDNRDCATAHLDRFAVASKLTDKYLPLVMRRYCYEYFGQQVRIVECNIYDEISNAEVVVEATDMNRARVEFSELQWHYSGTVRAELCEKSQYEVAFGELP